MAQLRDGQTSELLIQSVPVVVALLSERVDEVLFDGVGPAFNHRALLVEHRRRVADAIADGDAERVEREREPEREAEQLAARAASAQAAARQLVVKRGGRARS